MPDNGPYDEQRANHALLVGEVAGILSWKLDLTVEADRETGEYTGRVLIRRPSGLWVLTVEWAEPG